MLSLYRVQVETFFFLVCHSWEGVAAGDQSEATRLGPTPGGNWPVCVCVFVRVHAQTPRIDQGHATLCACDRRHASCRTL